MIEDDKGRLTEQVAVQPGGLEPDNDTLMLALDTSTPVLAAALMRGGQLLGSVQSPAERNHSAHAVPAVDKLLREAGVDGSQLGGIAAGQGPGSYTGVRIAASIAKTLAWTWGVPLLGVSSLESLAVGAWHAAQTARAGEAIADMDSVAGEPAAEQTPGAALPLPMPNSWVVPLLDARRGQVYTALFAAGGTAVSGQAPLGAGASAASGKVPHAAVASVANVQAPLAADTSAANVQAQFASDASVANGEAQLAQAGAPLQAASLPLNAPWSRLEPDGLRLAEPWAAALAERLEAVQPADRPEALVFTGDLDKHEAAIQQLEQLVSEKRLEVAVFRQPHTMDGGSVAWLGRRRLAGGEADDAHGFVPNYTQLAEAEAKLLEKPREA
ncbi:tRNA (adenosine(37)-N6)-threonylcarbamoyltransferase complex dimerization subunit type 1 TsaB [Paenibacillus pasadenensis]|uniref:tRNA (adenosine(37)-N6)-threonylcarbamoyltransferase complex dimerization subunit type 1 TsaB n=1 Tax=Paenibacillus pasadenensis TaxID=217090 RepID=UPI00203ED68C|nr:tRNA (adenosine(37)-N6)-threonylcarbamoyltransferase complex dimerization subunit type 1 TsaB [Paenibacillus pasadenensis]MCM3749122.1 tRNA (adenosine(37)-N6)-threonylcarbamoyltransferase complex dimerization subunit type 1 TsaB [Paenibacillus pasadenensis]